MWTPAEKLSVCAGKVRVNFWDFYPQKGRLKEKCWYTEIMENQEKQDDTKEQENTKDKQVF